MGYKDPVMLILHHHHTVVSPQRVGAITMTLSRRSDGKSLPQHLLWGWSMRANVINPSLDRRLGNGHQEQRGKEKRHVPEADAAHHREGAGQPDHAVAHLLRCRDTLHVRCEGHPPVLIV